MDSNQFLSRHAPQLDDAARSRLVATASLFEAEFTVDWLSDLTGVKAHQILGELEDVVRSKTLLAPKPGIYLFPDSDERQRWREMLGPHERERLHRQIVEILQRDVPDVESRHVRLTPHLLELSNGPEGCALLARAGDLHRKLFRTEQAFQCYAKALDDLAAHRSEEADQLFAETAVKYSKISTARHETESVLANLTQALQRARERGLENLEPLLEMHLAKNEWLRARYDRAIAHFERGWPRAKQAADPGIARAAAAFATFFLYWQGRFREAVESYENALRDVETFPKGRFPLLGAITAGYCYGQIGQVTQGLGMLDAIRTDCLEREDLYLASYAAGNMGEIMLTMRNTDDALHFLGQSVKMAQATENRWVWIVAQVILAFAYFVKGDVRRTVSHLKLFLKHSRQAQAVVHPYPYLLALSLAADKGELPAVHGLSVSSEVSRMVRSRNIFMQGLGHRYQALLMQKEGATDDDVKAAHVQSLALLEESGHQIELARSKLELARFYLSRRQDEQARQLTAGAAGILGSFNEALIPEDVRGLIDARPGHERLLKEMLQLGKELGNIRDHKDLVQRIISAGNRVTGAERGAIFVLEHQESANPRLNLRASKNLTRGQVGHPSFAASMKAMEKVCKTGEGGIFGMEPEEDSALTHQGTVRSMICVPMTFQGEVAGVLYHDNRLLSSAFKSSDLEVLSCFASLAALALENARASERMTRLHAKLHQEKQYYQDQHVSQLHFEEIVGSSRAMRRVLAQIEQVAGTDATVLVLGETGVGKELVARAVHRTGGRSGMPFISVQLSMISEHLIPSELLGHERGAFTGATQRRIGRFELADSGTLFLDEIGDISPEIQVCLLRVLQTRQFERVGGTGTITSDFRLIAATNRDLEKEMTDGRFRPDLFYRLNVFPIHVPPLRERREDTPLLANHFLRIFSTKMGKTFEAFPEEEMRKLMNYDWPGNVRELQNLMERGTILGQGPLFHVPALGLSPGDSAPTGRNLTLADNERRHILRVLAQTGWRVAGRGGAAEILDIPPSTLAFRMKKLGITRPQPRWYQRGSETI